MALGGHYVHLIGLANLESVQASSYSLELLFVLCGTALVIKVCGLTTCL